MNVQIKKLMTQIEQEKSKNDALQTKLDQSNLRIQNLTNQLNELKNKEILKHVAALNIEFEDLDEAFAQFEEVAKNLNRYKESKQTQSCNTEEVLSKDENEGEQNEYV